MPESHSSGNDISIEKGVSEYYVENEKTDEFEIPHLYQIQPILTVSEVVSSVKQSLEDFSDAVIPHRWSAPKKMVDQETQVRSSRYSLPPMSSIAVEMRRNCGVTVIAL